MTAEVAAQCVHDRLGEQVEALLFLNQFTTKKGGGDCLHAVPAQVTMVDTDQGWLVSDVETA